MAEIKHKHKSEKGTKLKFDIKKIPRMLFYFSILGVATISLINILNNNLSTSADKSIQPAGDISLVPSEFTLNPGESIDVGISALIPVSVQSVTFLLISQTDPSFKPALSSGYTVSNSGNSFTIMPNGSNEQSIIGWLTVDSTKNIMPQDISIDKTSVNVLPASATSDIAIMSPVSHIEVLAEGRGDVLGAFSAIGLANMSSEEEILLIIAFVLLIMSVVIIIRELAKRKRDVSIADKPKKQSAMGYHLGSSIVPVKIIKKEIKDNELTNAYHLQNQSGSVIHNMCLRFPHPNGWEFSSASTGEDNKTISFVKEGATAIVKMGDLNAGQALDMIAKFKPSKIMET